MFNHNEHQVAVLYNVPHAGKGRYFVYRFPNGYEALVSRNDFTFDGYRWHYELEFQDNNGNTFSAPDFGGLIKTPGVWLDEEDVENALDKIQNLNLVT